jgi:hypothetical protein
VDYGIPVGTQIRASAPGFVQVTGWDPDGYGHYVLLKHGDNEYHTYYCHLSRIAVQVGQTVERGDVVGLSGNTGFSTGPHLHWELRIIGKVNPGFKNCFNPLDYVGTPEPEEPPEGSTAMSVLVGGLRVRSGPGITYPVIGALDSGDVVYVTETVAPAVWVKHEAGWSAAQYNGDVYMEAVE